MGLSGDTQAPSECLHLVGPGQHLLCSRKASPWPGSPEGVPLPRVSSQVEDQGQLCVFLLCVRGDS